MMSAPGETLGGNPKNGNAQQVNAQPVKRQATNQLADFIRFQEGGGASGGSNAKDMQAVIDRQRSEPIKSLTGALRFGGSKIQSGHQLN